MNNNNNDALKLVAKSEQQIQEILEQHQDKLDNFLNDDNTKYTAARALVGFTLARHFALLSLEDLK